MDLSKLNYISYRQTSNISCTLVGDKIVDHSDVVGASPVGAAPTTSSSPVVYMIILKKLSTFNACALMELIHNKIPRLAMKLDW